jgi:hypothetical protein
LTNFKTCKKFYEIRKLANRVELVQLFSGMQIKRNRIPDEIGSVNDGEAV